VITECEVTNPLYATHRSAQKFAMTVIGDAYSRNCNLNYNLTATAIRIDWETATTLAVNYSVYMTMICLMQIGLLLRQLHHSQSTSVSGKVSILMLAGMALQDSFSTVFHVMLSVFVQNLFSAFVRCVSLP